MRVAFFGDTTHPNAAGWIRDLVELFGIEIHAVDYERPALGIDRVDQRVIVSPLPAKLRYLASGRPLRRVVEETGAELLVAYRVVSYGFAAARTGFHPLVLAGQGQWIVSVESPWGARWCARYALERADLCLAWAEHMGAAMRRLGAPADRVRVLNRGVRTDRFLPGPPERRAPIAVTARQLAAYYRTDLVVDGFAEAVRHGAPGELWITGEGPERASLESRATERGVADRVRFLGRIAPTALAEIYRTASAYVSMVPSDGVSSSLLEAMSAGLVPVVVDNEPNRSWMRGPGSGHLVPAGDVGALAAALTRVLSGELPAPDTRASNRELVVREADRRTNLATILEWWRELAGPRR